MVNARTVFHASALAAYAYTCWFDYNLVKGELLPIPNNFFSKFVWLTLIDLYIQTTYHLWGIFASLRKNNDVFNFVSKVYAGPIGMTVVFLFWALYLLDPDFLLHDENAKRILAITWYNNAIHSLPAATVLIDVFLWNHGHVRKATALAGIVVFAVLYIIDIHFVHYISGFWAYPILGQLPLPFRAVFIVACVSVFYVFFTFLDSISYQIHGAAPASKHKGKKQ